MAESYKKGADTNGTECKLVHLTDLEFNPILTYGYRVVSKLEPDLQKIQHDISDAEHLVFVYPNWWGTYPALLKGFIDRVFLPDFAFKYHKQGPFWDKVLTGKTAQLIVTTDTPAWYYWLVNRLPGHTTMEIGILEFSGIKPVKIISLGPVKSYDDNKRKQWLNVVEALGKRQC